CFGCGNEGHRVGECPEVQELLRTGIIKTDEETRRLRMSDGSYIRRTHPNEPL
ncbi:hypothetical protein DFH08DRAFT_662674, partial [Mycena albidolilacea]